MYAAPAAEKCAMCFECLCVMLGVLGVEQSVGYRMLFEGKGLLLGYSTEVSIVD